MRASQCRFHAKGRRGQCWRTHDGLKQKPKYPNHITNRCEGRLIACPKAEPEGEAKQ